MQRTTSGLGSRPPTNFHGPSSPRHLRLGPSDSNTRYSRSPPATETGRLPVLAVRGLLLLACATTTDSTDSTATTAQTTPSSGHTTPDGGPPAFLCHITHSLSTLRIPAADGGKYRQEETRDGGDQRRRQSRGQAGRKIKSPPASLGSTISQPHDRRTVPTDGEGRDGHSSQDATHYDGVARERSTTAPGRLRVCQWNCQGIRPKLVALLEVTRLDGVDVFLLQETLLPEGSAPNLPGFSAYHLHRLPGERRGLSIYVRHALSS